jgi:hypothetical protein
LGVSIVCRPDILQENENCLKIKEYAVFPEKKPPSKLLQAWRNHCAEHHIAETCNSHLQARKKQTLPVFSGSLDFSGGLWNPAVEPSSAVVCRHDQRPSAACSPIGADEYETTTKLLVFV